MTDEKFLELKEHIKELFLMSNEINYNSTKLKNEILLLDKSLSEIECNIKKIKSDVIALEEI